MIAIAKVLMQTSLPLRHDSSHKGSLVESLVCKICLPLKNILVLGCNDETKHYKDECVFNVV